MTNVLFYGDSLTDASYVDPNGIVHPSGYYADLVAHFIGATRVGQTTDSDRAGYAGTCLSTRYAVNATLAPVSGIGAFSSRCAAYKPDLLILCYGANDYYFMGSGADMSTWQHDTAAMLADCAGTETFVVGLARRMYNPAVLPAWAYDRDWLIGEMNAVWRDACRTAGIRFVDIERDVDPLYTRDGTHWTVRQHYAVAGRILEAMNNV